MSVRRVLTEEEEKAVISFYESHSMEETAKEFGFSRDWVGEFLRKKGISRDKSNRMSFAWTKRKQPIDEKEVIAYYLEPNSTKKVREKFGISDKRLNDILKRNNVEKRTKEESHSMRKQTNLIMYGEEYALQSPDIMEKRCKTNLERYGVEYVGASPKIIEKRKNTCIERFGTAFPSSTPEIRKKVETTMIQRFGVRTVFYLPEVEKKKEDAILEKFGGSSPFCSEEIREKSRETMIGRYGVASTMLSKELRGKQAKSASESKLEKRFREFLTNNDFSFEQQVTLCDGDILHSFDFGVYIDGELSILIDCDGLYYHGYNSDHDGKRVNLDADAYRQLLVPNGVKFLVVIEKHEEDAKRELFNLVGMSYDDYIQDIFSWCREVEFPYPSYNDDLLFSSYEKLCKATTEPFYRKARYGDKIMLNFHPSIYKAHKNGCKSPYEAWKDDETLLMCIKNRIVYKGSSLDRSKVLSGLSVTKVAPRVSLFSSYLAKYLINKYLLDYETVFDPFSGYSGRMLGACSNGKKYVGHDINRTTVCETNRLIDFLHLDANVFVKDILEDSGSYECLFTCPPYGEKEIWGEETVFMSCDEWIDECIKRYDCNRYVFVIDKTDRYQKYITEELLNKSHFGSNKELVVVINKEDVRGA